MVIEAGSITGPVKNLLRFCEWTQSAEAISSDVSIQPQLATYSRSHSKSPFVQAVEASAIPLHLIPESGPLDRSIPSKLRALASDLQPDLIQTHNVKSNFLIKASGLYKNYPWISFHHGYTSTDFKMLAYNQLDRWSLRSAHRVITVCQAFAPILTAVGVSPQRLRILHNSIGPWQSIPEAATAKLAHQFGLNQTDKIILTIGRLSREKGHADLLEALAVLARSQPQGWRAVLVGEGPEQSNLEQLAATLGISDRIIFAGFHAPVTPWYALADIFVLPSHSEGSPNVILEAMSAALPIAATNAGGTPEILTHNQTGLLSPVRNPRALAVSLDSLLKDPAFGQQMALRARQSTLSDFSPQCYRHNLTAIYKEVLSGTPAAWPSGQQTRPPVP